MAHSDIPLEEQPEVSLTPSLIRLSVGIEDRGELRPTSPGPCEKSFQVAEGFPGCEGEDQTAWSIRRTSASNVGSETSKTPAPSRSLLANSSR